MKNVKHKGYKGGNGDKLTYMAPMIPLDMNLDFKIIKWIKRIIHENS